MNDRTHRIAAQHDLWARLGEWRTSPEGCAEAARYRETRDRPPPITTDREAITRACVFGPLRADEAIDLVRRLWERGE